MKAKITTVALLLSFMWLRVVAQAPLVYSTENTGANCAAPPLPSFSQLPAIEPLPDPFMWADGRGRSTRFSDWECRRNEIKAQIENYEIGKRPTRPQNITASYAAGTTAGTGTLTVNVTVNGKTLTLTSQVSLPTTGTGPFPAIIGMNSPSGSVPATVFTSRNIARITYNHNNVTTYGGPSLNDPYYQLYPDQDLSNSGQYAAWSWGVSRLIDGLELVQASLPIDLQHIGVTGCSYAGKMALFSGAMDERIALTIAQESGGGGAPAWRVSETLGGVEKLGATDYRWFKDDMQQFAGTNVAKLPEDHHELKAMIAPRALLVTGNTDFEWLANPAAYVSARAAHEVWKQFGIGDRFGFYIDGGHNHCAVPATQQPAMEAFVDKFLLGNTSVNTNITVNPYPTLNYQRWYQWWGTSNPVLPPLPPEPLGKRIWLEAECATVGSDWSVVADTAAAANAYVKVKPGLSSPNAAPTAATALLTMPFTIDSAGTYNLRARLKVPVGEDYGYWLKIDGGAYQSVGSQLATNPGFENGLSGWTTLNAGGATISANNVAADAHSGTGSMKVVNPTARPGSQWQVQVTSTAFPTTIGKQYTISYWVRAAAAGGSIRLSTGPSSAQYQADQTIGTAWQQVTWTITAGVASTTFLFDMGQAANTYYIDDVSVKEVSTNTAANWQWVRLGDFPLSVGSHTLTIGYSSGGNTGLDKLLITSYPLAITGKGAAAGNCATPLTLSPATGPVGTSVTISGTNLSGATAVSFNGTAASSFVVNSAGTSITAIVAAGTTTGPVSVTTPSNTTVSATSFVMRVPPTTVADTYTTPQGVRLTGNVLTNDLGTNPRAILIIRPTHGVLVLNPDGSFSYQPAVGYTGSDSFIYYACDPDEPLLCGNPVTVSITVQRVAPTTVPDAYTTPQGVTLTGNVLSNDLGTNPRAILLIRPTHGTLLLNPDGTFTYQPTAGYVGADSFMYYACDPGLPLLCGNTATVSITVVPVTSARGAASAKPAATAKPSTDAPAQDALELALTGSPNPFAEQLRLRFALHTTQAYTLTVYDGQGRLVQQLASGQAEAGQLQELVVPTHSYAAGLYLVRLSMASGTQQLKLIKTQ